MATDSGQLFQASLLSDLMVMGLIPTTPTSHTKRAALQMLVFFLPFTQVRLNLPSVYSLFDFEQFKVCFPK